MAEERSLGEVPERWTDGWGSAWKLGPVVWTSEHEVASGSLSPPQAGLTVPELQPGGV